MIESMILAAPKAAPKLGRLAIKNPYLVLIIQIIIIVVALLVVWWLLKSREKPRIISRDDKPLDILNKRYAAGEITKADYERIKKDIQ